MVSVLSFLRKQESRGGGQLAGCHRNPGAGPDTLSSSRQLQNAQSVLGRLAAARFPSHLTFDSLLIQYEIARKVGALKGAVTLSPGMD